MYVTILLLHVKMMKSPFWGKNVLEFGFCEWNCIKDFNFIAVHEIYIGDFSNISTYRQEQTT
ncbi:hypothetical protein FC699_21725 [Bacillus wiedmannii]|uniref:Uncharacterized protein n=1 Tax=Bacillus wiedmannii TaxID=1890302 RepID=A0A4U3AUJ3_9BACI|nr:hypothetical protein FC694_19390 [Bacillus wiedmannii]TKI91599.1 hypothetical protein FC699_21725 [Bacillus wiedmannii]